MREDESKEAKFRQDTPKTQQGGNPKQHDEPSRDEHNDQNRKNEFGQDYAS